MSNDARYLRRKLSKFKWWVSLVALIAILTPIFVARQFLMLNATDTFFFALFGAFCAAVLLRWATKYENDLLPRKFQDTEDWHRFSARYQVAERPKCLDSSDFYNGYFCLADSPVHFRAEFLVSSEWIFANIQHFGRIIVPWKEIAVIREYRNEIDGSVRQMARIELSGLELTFSMSWCRKNDDYVSRHIGQIAA